ncbi:hypothetical protein [Flavobacterium sp.]|uniref:hypothetical protein n=1 Tax=Flavobacterium sp. TaxID=239 RepID=UPI003526EBC2
MKTKTLFLCGIIFLLFTSVNLIAQNSKEYNLPPGYKIHPKKEIIDLSYKIDENNKNEVFYSQDDLLFLKNLSDVELENLKSELPDYYNYIQSGKAFINSLSQKVKNIYTTNELWYIYAFDKKLATTISVLK